MFLNHILKLTLSFQRFVWRLLVPKQAIKVLTFQTGRKSASRLTRQRWTLTQRAISQLREQSDWFATIPLFSWAEATDPQMSPLSMAVMSKLMPKTVTIGYKYARKMLNLPG